jgi:type I restriction-modification system DNA methylase subunit
MKKSKKAEPCSDFRKVLDEIVRRSGHYHRQVFDAFVSLAACALALKTREPEYMAEAKRWKREELDLFAAALAALVNECEAGEPFTDLLGTHYMEWALSKSTAQHNGEFHTPQAVCELMARMVVDETSLPADGPITVCEPCSGAGAQILALGKRVSHETRRRLRVTAIDLNKTACDMTFINTTLWGIPCCVVHGNALTLETHAQWQNIHWRMPWLPLAYALDRQAEPPAEKKEAVA